MPSGHRFPIEVIDKAIELYLKRETTDEIAAKTGIKKTTLQRHLRARGLNGNWCGKNRTPFPHELRALEMYEQGFMLKEIQKQTGVDNTVLYRALNRFKDGSTRGKAASRKHAINKPDFFRVIDTDEKGYFLGFIVADGSVKKDLCTLEITLSISDSYILEKFATAIGSEAKAILVHKKTGRSYSRLTINSVELIQDLMSHGVIPNKTFKTFYPSIETRQAHIGFIRGLLDGDGTIGYSTRKNWITSATCRWLGTKALLTTLRSNIKWLIGVETSPPQALDKKEPEKTFGLNYYSHHKINKITQELYPDGVNTLCLERKRAKLEVILKYSSASKGHSKFRT